MLISLRLLLMLLVCALNNGDLKVTGSHVVSVYPCWDVGSKNTGSTLLSHRPVLRLSPGFTTSH